MPEGAITCQRCQRDNRPEAIFCDGCGAALAARPAAAFRSADSQADAADLFIGRERELAALGGAMDQALAGRGRIVALAGEPGIGKTRTAEVLGRYASQQDVPVLWGHCLEEPGAPPYWPWLQVIRACLAAHDDDAALREAVGFHASHVAEIVPEIGQRWPDLAPVPPTVDTAQARFRLFDAIAGFLRGAAAKRGLVLILDNLHWADAPSLRLLEFLAAGIGPCRLLLVATYRDIELSRHHPLSDTLGELARHAAFKRLRLTGLTLSETGRFMAAATSEPPPADLLATVHAQTEGNPLFVAEMARFLVREGVLGQADPRNPSDRGRRDALSRIPEGIREVIGNRLNRLSPLCNRVLATAAVIGRRFDLDVLARLLADELPDDQAAAAIEEALGASVVDAGVEPGSYQFSHALIRETLYDEIPAIRRGRLHLAVAMTLEASTQSDTSAQVSALAHHFCAALPGGDPTKAIEYARRAAERADTLFAWEEAARYYRATLQVLDASTPGAARERVELLIALGDAQTKAGANLEAAEVLQQAAGSAKSLGLTQDLARAARAFEEATWRPGLPGTAAVRLLQDALAGLGPEDSIARADVLSSLGRALIFSGAVAKAMEIGAQAEAMARRLGDASTLSNALRAGLAARWQPDHFDERMAATLEAIGLAQRLGDKERELEATSWRLFDLMSIGDLQQRAEEFETYVRLAGELRQPFYQYICVSSRAMLALFHGRFPEAETLAREALEFGRRMPSLDAVGIYGVQMFSLRREQGRLKELAPLVAHFVQATPAAAAWRPGLALVYSELGMRDEARAEFDRLAQDGFAAVPRDALWVTAIAYLADVCAFLRDADRAATLYAFLSSQQGRNIVAAPNIACYGSAARFLGALATTMARWSDAERHFESALQNERRQQGWPSLARTQCQYAEMLVARGNPGDRARAADLLDEALTASQSLGMSSLAQRAGALRDRLGRNPARPRHPAGLSSREMQVLDLVAAGKGNREIAERLFVSPNTVANHVRSILTKTNTANRTEAAAFALRQQHRDG